MKTFYVLLMRDASLLTSHEDFNTLQDLQYLAGPVKAETASKQQNLLSVSCD